MSERTEYIRRHFDALSSNAGWSRRRNHYYHREQTHYFRYLVSENKRVLELGCGSGDLLNALKPSHGVGIDISPGMVNLAREKYPHLTFHLGDANRFDQIPQEI